MTEPDDTTPDEPELTRSRRPSRTVLAVLVLALLAASGVAVWQAVRAADAEGEIDRRRDAARTASDFTIALLSYDFEDLDAQRDTIERLATDDFAREFEDAMAQGLGDSIEELQARATATVSEVLVSEVPGDRARAIVVADAEITSEAGSRTTTDTYLDVSMIFLDDRWQVDDVRTVATDAPPDRGDGDDGGDAPPDGGDAPPDGGDGGSAEPAG